MMSYLALDIVSIDHSYSKPWSAHPDASNARPLRTLYMEKFPRNRTLEQNMPEPDLPVNVITGHIKAPTVYDSTKARSLMNEAGKSISGLLDDPGDDWEDKVKKYGWTQPQNRLYVKVNKILNSDRMARLAYIGNVHESVHRRNCLDKTSKRFRQALGSVKWDTRLIQWLHGILLDNLGSYALTVYIEILQTLKAKIPSLIDRMTSACGVTARAQQLGGDSLCNLIKKPWDPVQSTLSQTKMKKLPGNPLILVAPSGPTSSSSSQSKRMRYWSQQLMTLGKVIPVLMHTVNNGSGVSIAQCLEHMIGAVKNKIVELRSHFVNRPIVLLGWNIGALVACHVALQESVSAVVCMGFPYTGVGGGRGDADDPSLDCRTPTLFVIGQNANTCQIDDMEDLREKMRAENSLVVVGGCDDNLRMSRIKKKFEAVTQMMVDKAILDEVSEFLGGVLSQGPMIQESVIVDLSDIDTRKRRKVVGIDELDGEAYAKQTGLVDVTVNSPQGHLSIAKALRARALGSVSSLDSPHSFGSAASAVPSPVRVKRKYTKRKNVGGKPPGVPSPRKRFRSTPTPPVASPVSSLQSPLSLSAGPSPNVAGVSELTGLLKSQPGMLPTFRIVTDESGQKTAFFSAPQTLPPPPEQQLPAAVNLPSPAILGTQQEEPQLIAYKLDDYNKKFGIAEMKQDPEPIRQANSIESILRNQQALLAASQAATATSTPISSLLSLARNMPAQITTTSSVPSQIQQLLSNLSRTQLQLAQVSAPSPVPTHGIAMEPISPSAYSTNSQSTGFTQAQINQSGSPLQNSVPTLMSSLAKVSGFIGGGSTKKMASSATGTHQSSISIQEGGTDKPSFLQRLEFQESPSPASSSSVSGTQTPDLTIDLTRSETPTKQTNNQFPLQITVNRSSPAFSVQQAPALMVDTGIKTTVTPFSPTVVSTLSHKSGGIQAAEEKLGQVSSMLESSPITQKQSSSVIDLTFPCSSSTVVDSRSTSGATGSVSLSTMAHKASVSRAPSSVQTSYTVTPKQSLSTLATTRTRRIRTPKQFDL